MLRYTYIAFIFLLSGHCSSKPVCPCQWVSSITTVGLAKSQRANPPNIFWTMENKDWLIHHDNTPARTALPVHKFLPLNMWLMSFLTLLVAWGDFFFPPPPPPSSDNNIAAKGGGVFLRLSMTVKGIGWPSHTTIPDIQFQRCLEPRCLTFRHRASCILGQAFRYSPENAFYLFNQQIYFIIWYLLDRASLI